MHSSGGSSGSSESWWNSGAGPLEQVSFLRSLALRVIRSCLTSSLHPEQQRGGHRDILTSPVAQSISGLCLRSQECPKISFCLPRLVTAKVVRSEWFL